MNLTMGTACAGIGGAEVAAMLADLPLESRWAIEIGQHQAAVLMKRLRVPVYRDAYECGADNLVPVDLFAAGFPCQPFSVAGRRGGAKDPRNLWPEIARITEEIGPRAVLFENVPALRNPHPAGAVTEDDEDAGEETPGALPGYLGTVLGDLVDLGYHVAWDGRSAGSIGAHHRRDRVWIVGWAAGSVRDFDPFRPEEMVLDARVIGEWTGERWEVPSLFGGVPVMKWPRAGIVRGRQAFEVGTSSEATARGVVWTTPVTKYAGGTAEQFLQRKRNANERGAHMGVTLSDLQMEVGVASSDWPTPRASENENRTTKPAPSHGNGHGKVLAGEVHAAMGPEWQTPQAHDAVKPDPSLWGTPSAEDNRDRGGDVPAAARRLAIGKQITLGMEAGLASGTRSGLLNPRWVEALMGYPPGWTDLEITNPEDLIAPWEVARAWGGDCYRVGDLEGTNPDYADYWLWHESLGALALPTAPREPQTKDRLVSLGNAWVPQVAAPIMARIVGALIRGRQEVPA